MSRAEDTIQIHRMGPAVRLALAALWISAALGCDPGDDEQPVNDMLPTVDMNVDLGVDMDPDPKKDAAPPPRDAAPDAIPDAAPPMERPRAPTLCVGCGAATSPRFRLIEHGLTPTADGPARAAESPRFRLTLEP